MFSLNYETKDPLRHFAISHFTGKTGIPFSINSSKKTPIAINYGIKGKDNFSVNIPEKKISTDVFGSINYNNIRFPIFHVPKNTRSPKSISLAEYQTDNDKYPCVSRSNNTINFGFDIFGEFGYILSGHHEIKQNNTKNEQNIEIFKNPVVDFYEELLLSCILNGCSYLNIPLIRKSYWPDGKKFAVCLTHDVDEFKKTYQWITRPIRSIKNKNYSEFKNQTISLYNKIKGKEPYWTFKEINNIENEYNAKSTYYFLKEDGNRILFKPENWHLYGRCHTFQKPKIQKLIKELYNSGHEIGVHGSTFSYENYEKIEEQKKEIEKIIGEKVHGIRQHRLNLNIPKTWEYQRDAGFLYDTTLGYKAINRNGFRFGTCFPFCPAGTDNNPLKILEIPLSIMDVSLPQGNQGWKEIEEITKVVEEFNGVLTLLWHPPVFNHLEYPHLGEYYSKMLKICKDKNAWFATGYDIASWWKERNNTSFSVGKDENQIYIALEGKKGAYFDIHIPDKKKVQIVKGDAEILSSDSKSSKLFIQEGKSNKNIHLEVI